MSASPGALAPDTPTPMILDARLREHDLSSVKGGQVT
jgi:hypothetical protein